jgi:hypothetical protein
MQGASRLNCSPLLPGRVYATNGILEIMYLIDKGNVKRRGHNGHCSAMKRGASACFQGFIDEFVRRSLFVPAWEGICERFWQMGEDDAVFAVVFGRR